MSRYLSSRRRLSEPVEEPQPRYQWRVRVNTLMMDDGIEIGGADNKKMSIDRREESSATLSFSGRRQNVTLARLDATLRPGPSNITKNEGRSASDMGMGAMPLPKPEDNCRNVKTRPYMSFRERRENLTRTKSEGHIKLRVKFSKTIEEDDDSSDGSPELSRRRGLLSRRRTLPAPEESSMRESHRWRSPETRRGSSGACAESHGLGSLDSSRTGRGGAIPKHINRKSSSHGSEDSGSGDENNFRAKRRSYRSSSPDSAIGESLPNMHGSHLDLAAAILQEDASSGGRSAETDAVNHGKSRATEHTCSRGRLLSEEDTGNDATGSADDIETIIEQIIAAEEKGETEEYPEPGELFHNVGKLIGSGQSAAFDRDIQQLRETINDCNKEAEVDSQLLHNTAVSNSLSGLSNRSNTADDDDEQVVVPFPTCNSQQIPLSLDRRDGVETVDNNGESSTSITEDDEDQDDPSTWASLPMILMEDVLALLTPKERHLASQVCRHWYDLFYSPRVWETFILLERTLTKKRFNLYKGYQRELCPGKTQICFRRVGSFFKRIVVTPITDYFNLYEFLRVLAAFLQLREDQGEQAMPLLHTFDFTFACATRGDEGIIIHGTGGQILAMIKQVLACMRGSLRHLKLNQLMLDDSEVPSLFNALVHGYSECLHSLEMLNVSKVPVQVPELARFENLVKLVVSPQHLGDETVLLLAGSGLLQLHILQDHYTCPCAPVPSEAWRLVREVAPWLRVYLELAGNTRADLLLQLRAPVHGIFLRTSYSKLTHSFIMTVVDNYAPTLRYLVQERLPRKHGPRGFENRCDSSLLYLVRRCPRLNTLVIRERISTATLILLATEGRNLSTLLVRQNALLKRCDWPQRGEFPIDFYKRLKQLALDYQRCTDEVCSLLRRHWRPMTDRQFKQLKIMPRMEMF